MSQTEVASQRQYICPGETHPISYAVHLSRLASFFPSCRECPFRCETGQMSQGTIERLQQTEHRVPRKSWLTAEGLRGVYLNELTRSTISQWACAFAKRLWEQPGSQQPGTQLSAKTPRVVIGHDERPFAFDLILGVAAALRRMGCAVIDLGSVTRPMLEFACDSQNANGGLWVTGAGRMPSWSGLDFFTASGKPISSATQSLQPHAITLEDIEQLEKKPVTRAARQAYPQQTADVETEYLSHLSNAFHGFRPLRICYASAAGLGRLHLEALFSKLSCKLIPVPIPNRQRDIHDPEDADVQKLSHSVRQQQSHLGVVIDEDGQHVAFLDEHGRLVRVEFLVRLLSRKLLEANSHPVIVLGTEKGSVVKQELQAHGAKVLTHAQTAADFVASFEGHQAAFAAASDGRYWFAEPTARCDAILTLARVLEALSVSDAPFSQAVL